MTDSVIQQKLFDSFNKSMSLFLISDSVSLSLSSELKEFKISTLYKLV